MKKKKDEFVDDGRVVANMNVEGMAWHNPRVDSVPESRQKMPNVKERVELSAAESRAVMRGTLGAALLAGFCFLGGIALFIFFCTHIWFA
ncbi:hypothetical protein LJC58_09350 [Lachnospiraceae bacterium OttesenSCG-928-D06]|nr:hypothetical protein [Lachnospiraceae bacterium OttesenSCG-928-D06]